MAAPGSVLLPMLFPNDLVSIGQLLCNPLVPNTDTFRDGCKLVVPIDDIVEVAPVQNYEAIVSVNKSGEFNIGLIKLLGAKLGGNKANMLFVKARSLQYSTLMDSVKVFRRICESSGAQEWIFDMVQRNRSCYLVIGIQTLHMTDFKRVVLKKGDAGGYATMPLEPTAQIPLYVEGKVSTDRFGSSMGNGVSGVFGIQVQRLDPHIGPLGERRLKAPVSWKWSYQSAEISSYEPVLDITLEDVMMEELIDNSIRQSFYETFI